MIFNETSTRFTYSPFTQQDSPVCKCVSALSVSFAIFPLTNIFIAVCISGDSLTVIVTIFEVAYIIFTVRKCVRTFTVISSRIPLANVFIAVWSNPTSKAFTPTTLIGTYACWQTALTKRCPSQQKRECQ